MPVSPLEIETVTKHQYKFPKSLIVVFIGLLIAVRQPQITVAVTVLRVCKPFLLLTMVPSFRSIKISAFELQGSPNSEF
jgi:hypothetical protein